MNKNILSPDFKAHPSVFIVEDEYKIIIPVKKELLVWIRVAGEEYYDDSNGILRSSSPLHQISVPVSALDKAKEYTVCYRKIVGKRVPYGTKTTDVKEYTYSFSPVVKNQPINIILISDSHGRVEKAVKMAQTAVDCDLLVMNGDIANHSDKIENIETIYHISSGITKGQKPCVFSRGNHDLRGSSAELLSDYTPTCNGKSYYTFRLGDLWGMVLDCGEDKVDSHEEYGNTICCHNFRLRETQFIKSVIEKGEYKKDGIKHRIVICHIPFTLRLRENGEESEFDIENDIYDEWTRIIGEGINPDFYLFGHTHFCKVAYPGDEYDSRHQSCPAVIGGKPRTLEKEKDGFTGVQIKLNTQGTEIVFYDNEGNKETA